MPEKKPVGWKPYAIGGAGLAASVVAGIAIYHATSNPQVGFTFDWPPANAGVAMANDGGTLACDAPIDGVDAAPSDGYYWGDACPPGSPVWTVDFRGKADPGATITLWRNNRATLIGTTVSSADGTWSIPGVLVPEGKHTILAEAVLDAKRTEASHYIYVDTTGPNWVLDGWEIPDGIDVGPDGVMWLALCGCPSWCPQGEYQALQPCVGGYKCGPGGDCHTDLTPEKFLQCRQSRRSGCIEITTAPSTDLNGTRMLRIETADFAEAGSWKVVGGSEVPLASGSTVTRVKTVSGYDPRTMYFVGDTIRVKDVGTCNLTGDQVRAITATAATYIDVTPALPVAPSSACYVENISRFIVDADPRTGTWDMTVGEKVQGRGQVNTPTVATIAVSGIWYVTVNSPYLDESVALGDYIDSAETPTAEQSEAWWAQTSFPSWVTFSACLVPAGYANDDGTPLHCMLPDEWR